MAEDEREFADSEQRDLAEIGAEERRYQDGDARASLQAASPAALSPTIPLGAGHALVAAVSARLGSAPGFADSIKLHVSASCAQELAPIPTQIGGTIFDLV